MKIYFSLVISLIIVVFASCKKDNNSNNTIPVVAVNLTLYVNNPSYVNLNSVGGSVTVAGGVRGILVYRYSTTEFKAYDRNCTYQSTNPCATVNIDANNIMAIDTCCKSQFLLVDGSVSRGPATMPLKSYNTSFDGNILRIYN
jgi:Rieske Fe-S protein